ncbi:MAG: DUF523 and DUF1722 domain-containing protein [Spirochaetales bacterium]|nr:DUF523 and DUF1722 domain-containing protein [Spirochaetales bacterium]MCF7937335.1 DUF523 and DUF1722 domain-containing protein [Spirochaetales bacterium]
MNKGNPEPRPRVLISRCLGFDNCRYNAAVVKDEFVEQLKESIEAVTVCPEVEMGLETPREPVRLVEWEGEFHLFQPATGKDYTEKMNDFLDRWFEKIPQFDGAILKSRSPSCGPGDVKVFNAFEQPGQAGKSSGFFGARLKDESGGFPIEDEGRLKNFTIREHFLTSIYTLARFRMQVCSEEDNSCLISGLVAFHQQNKMLFLAYNDPVLRELGRIVANHNRLPEKNIIDEYRNLLPELLNGPPKYSAMINSLQHAFGGFKHDLSGEEKKLFLNTLEEYRDERVPLSVPLHLLKSWAVRFDNQYLIDQTLLQPYPLELVNIYDSGKGRSSARTA